MSTRMMEKTGLKLSPAIKILVLAGLFAVIILLILLIRSGLREESAFSDDVAVQITQEMNDNKIVFPTKNGRRTVAEFFEPIIRSHGKESRLIVHTVQMSETISIANEGLGGWAWTSAYQKISYEGEAQYTVDLSQLTPEDFVVNNEDKTLTVRIPYAELSPINVPPEKIRFHTLEKGWAAPRDIKLTAEQNTQLEIQVCNKMKSKLIDDDVIADANESAKNAVGELLSTTVKSVAPEFSIIIVQ